MNSAIAILLFGPSLLGYLINIINAPKMILLFVFCIH